MAAERPTLISVRVKPRASVSELVLHEDGSWTAQIKSPPINGRSNAELCGLVAKHFGVPRSAVTVKAGAKGRNKWVRIQ